MGQLSKVEEELIGLGYQVIGISPDRPEKLKQTLGKSEVSYSLLSDSKMNASKKFGIAFKVDGNTIELYKKYNIDLVEASGEEHLLLPVPAVFLISDGEVKFSYVNPDYRVRIDTDALMAVARSESARKQ